jgi:hypothetical protein
VCDGVAPRLSRAAVFALGATLAADSAIALAGCGMAVYGAPAPPDSGTVSDAAVDAADASSDDTGNVGAR